MSTCYKYIGLEAVIQIPEKILDILFQVTKSVTKSKLLSLTVPKFSTQRTDRKKFQQKKVPKFRNYGRMQKIRQIVWFSFEIVFGSPYFYNYVPESFTDEAGMGTLPFPPKKTGHNRPAHLAVEAILNGESGGLFLLTHGSNGFPTEACFHCANKSSFVNKKKKTSITHVSIQWNFS